MSAGKYMLLGEENSYKGMPSTTDLLQWSTYILFTGYWEISLVCCRIARVPQAQVTIRQQTSDVSQYTVNNVFILQLL